MPARRYNVGVIRIPGETSLNPQISEAQLFDHAHRLLKTHETLLRDRVRNQAFYEALRRNVTPGSVVLDIGAGTGIWAITAAKLGAKKVVAIDMDELLIGVINMLAVEHGVADRVEAICANSFDVQLEREFDVVVSETIGYLGYDENIVAIMADARRRFLKKGGHIIPETVSLYAAAGHLKVRSEIVPVGIDLDFTDLERLNLHSPRVVKKPGDVRLLTRPARLIQTDLNKADEKPSLEELRTTWEISDAAEVNCFAVWVESRLTKGVRLSTRRTTSWLPNVYRVQPPKIAANRLELNLSLTAASNYWTVTFSDGDSREVQKYSPEFAAAEMLKNARLGSPEVALRSADAEDEAFLFAVYSGSRADEVAIFGWGPSQTESFLRMQFNIQKQAYRMQYPDAVESVIIAGQTPVGRTILAADETYIRIVDIAVLPEHRKKGIGTAVLGELRRESATTGRPLILHVEKTNLGAQRLYHRLGFVITAETDLAYEMYWSVNENDT